MTDSEFQKYRNTQLRVLTGEIGVYALCDLDEVPIYVGKSVDGIRARVRRHLTSARSDVIANRQIDVWEVAFVWAWPMGGDTEARVKAVEAQLYHLYNNKNRLMNGQIPNLPDVDVVVPKMQRLQIIVDDEIESRKRPALRLPRQIQQFQQLVDYMLHVKDQQHLHESLTAHFERLQRYYEEFQSGDYS